MYRLSALLIIVLLLVGCSKDERELVLSTNNWMGYMPLYLARDAGYYDDIPLHLVQLPSNTETMRSFRNGMVSAAGLTLDEALLLAESGVPICIPLIMDYSNGADALVASAELASLAQLKGKRIGVENTAVGAHMLTSALERAGLSMSEVKVVPMEVQEHVKAFGSGRIDALVTFDPVRSQLLEEGARELFNSAEIPGEITDVLVVHREYLANHPEVVSHLIDGWFRLVERLKDDNEMLLHEALAGYSGLDTASVSETLRLIEFPARQENREILRDKRAKFRSMALKMNQTMLRQQVIGSRVPVDKLLCSSELLPVYH